MASNPLYIMPEFFMHFSNELWYLRFEGNGEIPLERQGKKFAELAVSV